MTQPIQTTAAITHMRRIAGILRGQHYKQPTESLIADLIEHQALRIEVMRAALVEAREIIDVDRRALAECSRRPDGSHEPGDASALADYDRRLALIDAALEDENTLRADELGEQARRIAAMTEALTRAHAQVAMDRELFVRGAAAPGQPLDPDDQEIADEYIALLRMIDEAMGDDDDPL